jgi:hypothetical protein
MRKELSKCANKIVDTPRDRVFLIDNLLAQQRAISLSIGFKGVLSNFRCLVIRTSMVNSQEKQGPRHSLLIDLFEVFQYLQELSVVVRGHMTELKQKLPRLQHLVAFVEIIDPIPLLEKGYGRVVWMSVRKH